jgi:hypothetical protein
MKSTFLVLCLLVISTSAVPQQPREKPKELDVLSQYIGDWTSDVTNRPAVWAPKEVKYRTSNHAEFVLGGRFLQHIEVNHIVGEPEKVTKAIWLQSFDAAASKYVTWFFQSSGNISHATGTWDAATRTFEHSETMPPPGVESSSTTNHISVPNGPRELRPADEAFDDCALRAAAYSCPFTIAA